MIVLVSSTHHQSGASVLVYMLTKMYGNLNNLPCCFMSLNSPEFYKSAIELDPAWISQAPSLVLNKLSNRHSFRSYCYKMEETVFYYHATSSTLDTPQGIEAIKKVIDAAGKAFSVVVVDIDLKINGFFPLIPVADEILLSITTDSFVLRTTGEHIKKLRNQYEMAHGLKIKPNIYYVLNKYDRTMSFPNVSKILGVKPRDVMSVPYVKQLAIARNNKRLDYFAAEMLSNAKDPYMRELYVYLKRIMDRMKNEGGVKT